MASVQSHFWWLVRKSGFRHKVSLRPRARGSRGPWGQARVLPASLEQLLSHSRGRRLRQADWPDASPPHQCDLRRPRSSVVTGRHRPLPRARPGPGCSRCKACASAWHPVQGAAGAAGPGPGSSCGTSKPLLPSVLSPSLL